MYKKNYFKNKFILLIIVKNMVANENALAAVALGGLRSVVSEANET
jgi:hypothetical protein